MIKVKNKNTNRMTMFLPQCNKSQTISDISQKKKR